MMSNLDDEMAHYRDKLDKWIEALGLPQYQPDNKEVEVVLEFTRESLRERSSVELSEDAVILAQFALFLQQKTNECNAFIRWSGQVAKRLLGEDRTKLTKWVRAIELRIDRISYVTRRIELVGQSIGGLVRARYNEGRN
jgi:hypothetical protein